MAPQPFRVASRPRVPGASAAPGDGRLQLMRVTMVLGFLLVAGHLFYLQVVRGAFYATLASDRPATLGALFADRGNVYMKDPRAEDGRFPAAINRNAYVPFADTKNLKDAGAAAKALAPLLGMSEGDLMVLMSKKNDPYIVLSKKVDDATADKIRALKIKGINLDKRRERYYPEGRTLAHVTGYLGYGEGTTRAGKYGVEGNLDAQLAGVAGGVNVAGGDFKPAKDGDELTLTIDRSIQYVACERLQAAVTQFGADGGSVVIADPKTGAVLAMCNVPSYDPNDFSNTADISVFNNSAIYGAYEPGSVFKPLVMAAAIDAGVVTPNTTFTDTGSVKIGQYTIRNSDGQAHGLQTMTQVLEESLNTGMIFVVEKLGPQKFLQYVQSFGFGSPTGIEMDTEAAGNIESLRKKGDIWSATGSFGQGLTVTPMQLVAAYGALANGGKLMRPYIVAQARHPDGNVTTTDPEAVHQVITRRAAGLVGGMLVNVVENGHGKRAKVPGYWVGGKTGTAQVSRGAGLGYDKDASIGSFVGFAPIDDPAFVMAVQLIRPKEVEWAESSAAPLFGEIAKFLMQYMQIPPVRPL